MDFDFDVAGVLDELTPLIPLFRPMAVAERPTLPEHRREFFMVADDEHYDGVDRHRAGVFVPGRYRSLEGLSVRFLPGRSDSVLERRPVDEDWQWRPGLKVIPETLARLPLATINNVRVISIPEGGFLPVHRDAFDDAYWESGYTTLTLQLLTGGVPLMAWIDGRVCEIDAPAFFFRDSVPHGTPVTKSRRLGLRVSGRKLP